MGQSLVKNYLHITFSTKNREKLITGSIERNLHKYLARICNNLECTAIKVGGHYDHIHILCLLSKKITLIKLLEELKKESSKWMKTNGINFQNFYWQKGYGAFSINPSEINIVIDYINKQYEHHRERTFKDEFRAFLKKYNVNFDEKYVWD